MDRVWAPRLWHDEPLTQVAVAWVLACVFVRFSEDNGLVEVPKLAGPGALGLRARDEHELFFQKHPTLTERDYLESVFTETGTLPAMRQFFDRCHNPLWQCGPSGDAPPRSSTSGARPIPEPPFAIPVAAYPKTKYVQSLDRLSFHRLSLGWWFVRSSLSRTLDCAEILRLGLRATAELDAIRAGPGADAVRIVPQAPPLRLARDRQAAQGGEHNVARSRPQKLPAIEWSGGIHDRFLERKRRTTFR